jgi:hypothetical protein
MNQNKVQGMEGGTGVIENIFGKSTAGDDEMPLPGFEPDTLCFSKPEDEQHEEGKVQNGKSAPVKTKK